MKWNAKTLYNSCFKKKRFRDWTTANNKAKKYNQRVYFCNICGCYHLTSHLDKDKYL